MLSRQALCSLFIGALALTTLDACGRKKPPRTVVQEEEDDNEASSKSSKSGGDNLDHWDEQYALVKGKAPDLEKGAAIVVRFVNEKKGTKISLVYLTEEAPQFKEQIGSRVIIAKAKGKNETVLSTVTIIVKKWEAGKYPCSTGPDVVAIGAAISDEWDPKGPETYWTMNDNGTCEVEITSGDKPGDLQAHFHAKLTQNKDASNYLLIDNGYFYVKRF